MYYYQAQSKLSLTSTNLSNCLVLEVEGPSNIDQVNGITSNSPLVGLILSYVITPNYRVVLILGRLTTSSARAYCILTSASSLATFNFSILVRVQLKPELILNLRFGVLVDEVLDITVSTSLLSNSRGFALLLFVLFIQLQSLLYT